MGAEWQLPRSEQSTFALTALCMEGSLLLPVRHCWSGRTHSPVAARIWLPDFGGCGGSLGVKGPDPGMVLCASSRLYQTPISFPLPQQLLDVWRISCALLARLSTARAWEMRSYGKMGLVEPRRMWNLASGQIKITFFYGHLHLCLWGWGYQRLLN